MTVRRWRDGRHLQTLELVRTARAVLANVGEFGFAGKRVCLSPTGSGVVVDPDRSTHSYALPIDAAALAQRP